MKLNVYIVDDHLFAVNILSEYVNRTPGFILLKSTTNPYEAMNDLNDPSYSVDVCFMDIKMKGIDGLQLARIISDKLLIVFTTGMKMYALASHEFDPVDYLIKPISYERFLLAVHKIWARYSREIPSKEVYYKNYIFIPGEKDVIAFKLNIKDIMYLESASNYCFIYTSNGDKKLLYTTIKDFEETLNPDIFIRPHRSFLVNIEYIFGVNAEQIILQPPVGKNITIPIGKTYKPNIKKLLG